MKWIDKCRCGRIIQVQVASSDGKPAVTKDWYDKEGVFERTTGESHLHEIGVSPSNSPPQITQKTHNS